jgi:hypothetical protein
MQFMRLVDRRLVINPSSIGIPYGRHGGHWALLQGGTVAFHRVKVDPDTVVRAVVADSSYPDRDEWANYSRSSARTPATRSNRRCALYRAISGHRSVARSRGSTPCSWTRR